MHVVLSADMEGVAQLCDPREVTACSPRYWATGRARMGDDVVAAATGLLSGGATHVSVLDNHASGNPHNLLAEVLPDGARLESWNVFELRDRGVEAMLQVGYHARAGINGFFSHTYCPGLRLRVSDELIGESHGRIWAARVPLLGIVGSDAHERTLGSLEGTPYLAVQRSDRRAVAAPVHQDAAQSAEAIRAFAEQSIRDHADAPRPLAPASPVFRARLRCPAEARGPLQAAGWTPAGDGEFVVELGEWAQARAPLAAVMSAANISLWRHFEGLDVTSEAAMRHQDPAKIEGFVERFVDWATGEEPEW